MLRWYCNTRKAVRTHHVSQTSQSSKLRCRIYHLKYVLELCRLSSKMVAHWGFKTNSFVTQLDIILIWYEFHSTSFFLYVLPSVYLFIIPCMFKSVYLLDHLPVFFAWLHVYIFLLCFTAYLAAKLTVYLFCYHNFIS